MKKLEDYKGKVIKVLNKEHGKKVIKFWKSLGVDTVNYNGGSNEEDNDRHIYYGLTYGCIFDNNSKEDVINLGLEIIELPKEEKEPEYPYKAYVWDKEKEHVTGKFIRWVYGKINNLYITSSHENIDTATSLHLYEKAEPIPLKTKLTKQQIADKFGIDINNIEIVD